jgi:hypothetical protein
MSDYSELINRYNLDQLLEVLAVMSAKFVNGSWEPYQLSFGVCSVPLQTSLSNGYSVTKYFYISIWNLIDIAYDAIKLSGEVNLNYSPSELDILMILQKRNSSYELPTSNKKGTNLYLALHGALGEQLKVQKSSVFIENYCRQNYILNQLSNDYAMYDVNALTLNEVGVTSLELSRILYLLYLISLNTPYILQNNIKLKGISAEKISRVVEYYSSSYDEIRQSSIDRQKLYISPFIKNSSGQIICVNSYVIYDLFQNAPYWIIRNYYNNLNSQDFIRAFGTYFEKYIEMILDEYVGKEFYFKIPTDKLKKSADYKVHISQFDILIEAKSGLVSLSAKQQNSDISSISKYMENHLIDGVLQLNESEKFYKGKQYIKIILVYEDYFKSELLSNVFTSDFKIQDDGYYWMVRIAEFEKLLYTLSNNPAVFQKIMEKKIEVETKKSSDGRDFDQIFPLFGVFENEHIKQEKYHSAFREVVDYIVIENMKEV